MTTKTENIDLEQLLNTLPEEQRHRAIIRILENANFERIGPYKNKEAEDAAQTLSPTFLMQTLEYYSTGAYEDRDTVVRLLAEGEGVRRKNSSLMRKGAEKLEVMADELAQFKCENEDKDQQYDFRCRQYLYRAADLYAGACQPKKAATLYESIKSWDAAANQWKEGCEWEKACLAYRKAERFEKAAECAELYNVDFAIRLAVQGGFLDTAIGIATRHERYDKALKLCDTLERETTKILTEKARVAKQCRKYDDAVSFYEQAGNFHAAATLAKEHQLPDASRLYETLIRTELHKMEQGLATYETAEQFAYEAERWDFVGEIREKRGDLLEAAHYFRRAGLDERAHDLLQHVVKQSVVEGFFDRAAQAEECLENHAAATGYRYLYEITKKER